MQGVLLSVCVVKVVMMGNSGSMCSGVQLAYHSICIFEHTVKQVQARFLYIWCCFQYKLNTIGCPQVISIEENTGPSF